MRNWLILCLLLAIISPALAQTQSNDFTRPTLLGSSGVVYVDPNGTDAVAVKGSLTKPFKTITAAINAAASGDIVSIGPGTYTENVTLKSGITLAGVHPRQCVISGNVTYTVTGGALTDVAHMVGVQVTGTISCDFTGKTGSTSYGFLDIRSCQFPTVTCSARAGLGNDGVSVKDFFWDVLPETFALTCTNGFADVENGYVGTFTTAGDCFGYAMGCNVTTLTVNGSGGFNFYNGVVVGPSSVAASLG